MSANDQAPLPLFPACQPEEVVEVSNGVFLKLLAHEPVGVRMATTTVVSEGKLEEKTYGDCPPSALYIRMRFEQTYMAFFSFRVPCGCFDTHVRFHPNAVAEGARRETFACNCAKVQKRVVITKERFDAPPADEAHLPTADKRVIFYQVPFLQRLDWNGRPHAISPKQRDYDKTPLGIKVAVLAEDGDGNPQIFFTDTPFSPYTAEETRDAYQKLDPQTPLDITGLPDGGFYAVRHALGICEHRVPNPPLGQRHGSAPEKVTEGLPPGILH